MAQASPFSARLTRVRRNPLGFAGIAALPAALLVTLSRAEELRILAPHMALAGVILAFIGWRLAWFTRTVHVHVRANSSGVTLDDDFVPRGTITAGFVLPGSPPRVRLRRRFRMPIELGVASIDEGRDLLRALRLDASQSVATFTTLSPLATTTGAGIGVGFAIASVFGTMIVATLGGTLAGNIWFTAVVGLLLVSFVPGRLRVGADGISWRWLTRDRFIAYEDVDLVSQYERGIGRSRVNGLSVLRRASGDEILIPIANGRLGLGGDTAVVDERIREAMDTSRRRGDAEADAALLRRGDRGVAPWIASLRSLGAGANIDMRTAPMPRERLFRIVEDPALAAGQRAAAAVALGHDLDDDGKARLHEAAASTAGTRLRVAIEAAAREAPDEEISAALEALDEDVKKARAQAG